MPILQDVHGVSFNFEPGGALPFDALIDLEEYNDVGTAEGAVALVGTFKSLWVKLLNSPPPVSDGVTVVPTLSGDGGWYRTIESPYWQTQATWYIDPATGDDENDGNTAGTALASWAEFTRRVHTIPVQMTVTILGDITEVLVGAFVSSSAVASLTIVGSPTVLATATGTTFTDPVRSGAQVMGTMTAADVADFSLYVGRMLRAGTTYAPIIGSSGVAPLLPYWCSEAYSNTKPAGGTATDILQLPTAPSIQIVTVRGFTLTGRSPCMVQFQGFVINGNSTLANGVLVGSGTTARGLGQVVSVGTSLGLGVFNCTSHAVDMQQASVGSFQSLFGSGNGGYGLHVNNGGQVWLSTTPAITGTSGDLQFCAAATATPPLVAGAAVPAAQALTTWADWANPATFNKNVRNYANGSAISGA